MAERLSGHPTGSRKAAPR